MRGLLVSERGEVLFEVDLGIGYLCLVRICGGDGSFGEFRGRRDCDHTPFFYTVNTLWFSFFLAFAALGQIGITGMMFIFTLLRLCLALHVLSSGFRKEVEVAYWSEARRMKNRRRGKECCG